MNWTFMHSADLAKAIKAGTAHHLSTADGYTVDTPLGRERVIVDDGMPEGEPAHHVADSVVRLYGARGKRIDEYIMAAEHRAREDRIGRAYGTRRV